jgi:hypothetical protein
MRRGKYYSPLGHAVCERCHERVNGMIVGGMTGGVGGAVVGPSILRWVRKSMGVTDKQRRARQGQPTETSTSAEREPQR